MRQQRICLKDLIAQENNFLRSYVTAERQSKITIMIENLF